MHGMRVRSLDPARVLTAVLALALGLQIAWTLTGLLGGRPVAGPDTSSLPTPGTDPLDAIRAARLFGTRTGPEPTAQPEAAPVSTQGLLLRGVLAETDPRAGRAIIGEAAGGGRVYAVGGTLPGGSRLAEVYPDRVILDRGGSFETLPLPRQAGGAGAGEATSVPGGMAPPPMAAAAGPSAEDITQVIRWQAVMRADKPSGVRVYPGANAQLFSQLGLRPGDLVLAINDSPLADQANGEQFIRSLAGTPQARLTIERAGRTESLLVDLATLSNPLNANPINSVR
jgi:general secretion pathway protein C